MRCFVTGSTGFLGRHFSATARARGDFVVALVRDDVRENWMQGFASGHDVRVTGDLSSLAFLERVIAEHEVDVVMHLAAQAQVSVAAADPTGTLEANVRGTWNVLEACRRQNVRRVVIAMSDKVYAHDPAPYREDQPLGASEVYGTSKACADLIADTYMRQYTMPIAIVRTGNLYGPGHTNFSTLIPDAIRCALKGWTLVLRSDGKMRRDFLFVGDAVDGYLKLADSVETGPFNFGNSEPHSVLEVVAAVSRATGAELKVDIRGTARGEIQEQWLDASKARVRLGWTPAHALDTGLAKTVPWYREYLHA